MDWLKVRMAPLGVLAVLACSGDPTDNQGTPTAITATPDVVFVTQGDSEAVVVSVVDEQGQTIEADFTTSDVRPESRPAKTRPFRSSTTPSRSGVRHRFFVKASTLTHTNFKVNALGLTKTIDVTVVPGLLDAADHGFPTRARRHGDHHGAHGHLLHRHQRPDVRWCCAGRREPGRDHHHVHSVPQHHRAGRSSPSSGWTRTLA